jgi:hypothetical protein
MRASERGEGVHVGVDEEKDNIVPEHSDQDLSKRNLFPGETAGYGDKP